MQITMNANYETFNRIEYRKLAIDSLSNSNIWFKSIFWDTDYHTVWFIQLLIIFRYPVEFEIYHQDWRLFNIRNDLSALFES